MSRVRLAGVALCLLPLLASAQEAGQEVPTSSELSTLPAEQAPSEATPAEAPERTSSAPSPAEEARGLVTQPVVVTGSWLGTPTEASTKKYPGTRTVLEGAALTQSGARTLEDALRVVPGVRVQDESGTGLLPNIGVRGLTPSRSEQVLVLVDGIPLAPAPYGQTGLSLFPVTLQTLAAVDVARGGIAVHYGPNNVGGVINLVTRPIPNRPVQSARLGMYVGPRQLAMGDVYARAGGFVSDRLGLQLQANGILGDSSRSHSHTRAANLIGDVEWLPTEALTIKGKLQYYDAQSDLPGALTPEAYAQDPTRSERLMDRFAGRVVRSSVVATQQVGEGEVSVTAFGHTGTRLFAFAVPLAAGTQAQRLSTSPRDYLVLGSEVRQTLPFEALVSHQVTWGVRYVNEDVDYVVDNRDLQTDAYQVARDWWFGTHAIAGYASDTLAMLDGRLKVTPGLRFEWLKLSYLDKLASKESRNVTRDLLPGLSVGYQVLQPLFVYGNYHRSFRPVQFTQITFGNELASERAQNWELGLRTTPLQGVELGLAYFDIRYQDKLEFVSQAVGYRNLGKARHAGLETSLELQPLSGLDVRLAYTYLDATQRSGKWAGNMLPYASRHEGSFRVGYRRGAVAGNLNGACRSDAFSDAENTVEESADGSKGLVPGACVVNLHVSNDVPLADSRLRLGLGLNNVLDTQTYTRNVDYSLGRVPSPGRSVLFTVEFER